LVAQAFCDALFRERNGHSSWYKRKASEGSMKRRRGTACGVAAAFVVWIAASVVSLYGQSSPSPSPPRPTTLQVAAPKSLPSTSSTDARRTLDRYCVTCHNDRLKTANLSLQGLDLTTVGDQAELWEKVIRKLRAGVMP